MKKKTRTSKNLINVEKNQSVSRNMITKIRMLVVYAKMRTLRCTLKKKQIFSPFLSVIYLKETNWLFIHIFSWA